MTDNERIARAMGWRRSRPGITGRRGIIWVRGRWEQQKNEPDYFANPALLSEMLNWLAERYGFVIERIERQGGFSGCWIVSLYLRDAQVYVDDDYENAELQESIARCVLWALEQGQGLLDAQYGR